MQPETDRDHDSRRRTVLEALGWIALIAFLWTADTLAKITYRNNTGIGKDDFRLINDQVTSAIAVLIMVVFVVYWLRVFPLRRDRWAAAIIGHTFGSMIFAFGHHILMIVQRVMVYSLRGMNYQWQGGFLSNLLVEYQKDIKIYLGVVAIMSAYQYYRRQQHATVPPAPAQRLLVQTGTGESMLRHDQIAYLEASRNYVAVHADNKEYLVRDTISNLEKKLALGPFARCHRSFVVNLDQVQEIRYVDGAHRIALLTGDEIPLSRGYRDKFRSRISNN